MSIALRRASLGWTLVLAVAACAHPEPSPGSSPAPVPSGIGLVDLKKRLDIFASDSMEGRQAGALGNLRATAYLAAEAERLGLEPGGEGGTYFQRVPLVRRVLDEGSSLTVNGRELRPWTDFLPRDQGPGSKALNGVPVVYGGNWRDEALIDSTEANGKLVVLAVSTGPDGEREWSPPRDSVSRRFRTAAGIAVASLHLIPNDLLVELRVSELQLSTADSTPVPAYMYVSEDVAIEMLGAPVKVSRPGAHGRVVQGHVAFRDQPTDVPARNVVAVLPGRDPGLGGQYVALGAHNDHVGLSPVALNHDSVRIYNRVLRRKGFDIEESEPNADQLARVRIGLDSLRRLGRPRRDSIFNGADDDGSGSIALLGIAESLAGAMVRPRRSILFVWHSAEELGALGSRHFMDHPTVPRDSIVAQVNMDAIGRGTAEDFAEGGPTYLQLIGPERLSTELAQVVHQTNRAQRVPFVFDRSTDAPGHPDQIYCRSDHMNYARYGIPVAFFFAGFHFDFHHVTDEAEYIDYVKLSRVAQLAHDIVQRVADLDHRVARDGPKPDPEAECVQ